MNKRLIFLNTCQKSLFVFLVFGHMADIQAAWEWNCRRVSQPITVDGLASEWSGMLTPAKGQPFELGLQYDQDFIYVCLYSEDAQFKRMILTRGINLWFDPKGKKNTNFGIHYPMGVGRVGLQQPEEGEFGYSEPGDEMTQVQERLNYLKNDLEVLGPGKDQRKRVLLDREPGIQAAVTIHEEGVVLELRVPLHASSSWSNSIGVQPDSVLSFGLLTPEFRGKKGAGSGGHGGGNSRSGGGRSHPGGGMGSGADGMRGMGGEGRSYPGGMGGVEIPIKPLKIWLSVVFEKIKKP